MSHEVVEKEGESRCSQAEVESEEHEALEIAQLLSGESITAEREQLLNARRAHFNLRDSQQKHEKHVKATFNIKIKGL